MKAVIYARYSSDNQREESIEGQIRDCMQYAEYNDIQVVGSYIDRAMSAKTDNRPNFRKMIADSSKHIFDLIIVWKLDRFARNRYDSAYYKNVLRKNGVKVVSAKETISEGAEGIILESVLEGYAEYYSVELAEKVNRGMTDNALKAMNNGGVTPLGYYVDDEQHLQIDEKKAPFVREIFQRYADGEMIKDIINDMNARGVGITIRMKKKAGRKAHERKLDYNNVRRMLANRKYIGEYRFKDIVIEDAIPAIIDKDLFEKVQKRIALNTRAPATHKAQVDYLLTTKLYCGKCKAMMVGESGTGKMGETYRYYKCANAKKRHTCDKKSVNKEKIEDAVVKAVMEKIMDDGLMEQLSYKLYDIQMQGSNILLALQQQLADVEKGINNILDAIQQGIITDSTKKRLEDLENKQKELQIEVAQEQIKRPMLTREQILYGLTRFRKLDVSTQKGKKALIDGFVNAIYLYDDYAIITCNYKEGETRISYDDIENSALGDVEKGQKNKPELESSDLSANGDPAENRTRD
ncbi:MAG: recombinase family protein [Clostridia bacterium]|nr:recombinase family protein [Clostridia bacterium]